MGISSLLPILKPAMKPVSMADYRGQRVGVDGNLWIHRGAYACALELHCGQNADAYVRYCTNMAQLLIGFGVRPVVIFDGNSLGAKAGTADKRREGRQEATRALDNHLESLRELELQLASRPHDVDLQHAVGAEKAKVERGAQGTIRVTREMVERVMGALRRLDGVEVLRAPYEADAQLAFLARSGAVSAVLTEDSDLAAYACPCVLYKLERHSGMAMRLRWADLQTVSLGKGLSLAGFDEKMFLELCVLCGCDYLDSIKNLGLKTALKLMARLKDGQRVIKHLRTSKEHKGIKVPDGYAEGFRDACFTFNHQRVWSPAKRCLVHLREPLPTGFAGDVDVDLCCGPNLSPADAGTFVHAGAPVPAQDPFSKAAAAGAAAAAAAAAAQAPANPFLFQRRGAADGTAPSPSRRGSRSAGKRKQQPQGQGGAAPHASPSRLTHPHLHDPHSPVIGQYHDEVEMLLADGAASAAAAGRRTRGGSSRGEGGGGGGGAPSRRPAVHYDQFDDDDDVYGEAEDGGEMTAAWEAAATRRRLDPSYSQPVPPPPDDVAAADDAEQEGGGGAAAYDAFLGGDDDADASWPLAPADQADGEPRYGDGGDYEPTVDDLVSHARAAGDAAGEEGPPVAPSPARRLRDLYAQQRSPVASQPPARPHAEPTPPQPVAGSSASTSAAPANPFAGARKAPAWARRGEVPPGTGKFDALHPFGALSPTHGGGEGTAVDAHATRSAGGSARRTSARVAAGSASASPPGGERASARARPTPPPAPAEPKPAAKQTAAAAAAAAARLAPVKAATAAAAGGTAPKKTPVTNSSSGGKKRGRAPQTQAATAAKKAKVAPAAPAAPAVGAGGQHITRFFSKA